MPQSDRSTAISALLAERDRRRRHRGEDPASPANDRDRAIQALRYTAAAGESAGARVQAARALLEQAELGASGAGDRVLVVFRGREGKGQQVTADATPEEIAAALEHIRAQRMTDEQRQLEQFAEVRGISADDLAMAWDLYSHADARAAAMRVYLMAQSVPAAVVTVSTGDDNQAQ